MQVTSATITGPSGSLPILAQYGDGLTADPINLYKNGWAVIIPGQMAPNSIYSVTVKHTMGGVAESAAFTFLTGN